MGPSRPRDACSRRTGCCNPYVRIRPVGLPELSLQKLTEMLRLLPPHSTPTNQPSRRSFVAVRRIAPLPRTAAGCQRDDHPSFLPTALMLSSGEGRHSETISKIARLCVLSDNHPDQYE